MPNAVLLKTRAEEIPDAPPESVLPERPPSLPGPTPGSRPLAWLIVLLIVGVFLLDLDTKEYFHIGMLYNVCIALTLWSRRPRWVIGATVATVLLRLVVHGLQPYLHLNPAIEVSLRVEAFNLSVGVLVQALTGALIWRQVLVQHQLEAEERQTYAQARELERALTLAQQAAHEAHEATAREREARLRVVEARRREHTTLQALERVRDLSAALSRAVLPTVPGEIAGGRMRLCARYTPAERDIHIGGDFYDLIALDETQTRYALVIGDVAGHGVEAAAQTALVTSTLRTCAFEDEDGPASVLARAARTLEGQLESFVSLFYGVYDADAQTLTYACAGHEPPILTDPAGGPPVALNPTGPIFGVGLSHYHETVLPLRPGCTLIFLTDGLTEVRRGAGEMLDWEGVAEIVARQAARSDDADQIADGILAEVRAWAGRTHLTDDVALLVARVA